MRIRRSFLCLLIVISCFQLSTRADGPARTGVLNGAQYRIDLPEIWNGQLVVFARGYNLRPGSFQTGTPLSPLLNELFARGFAIAQSGYSEGGWAIRTAFNDTETLRDHFAKNLGQPKRTYVVGESMGAFVALMLLESSPSHYDGALALCGPLSAASSFLRTHAFDLLVVFEYVSNGLLPSPARVPSEYVGDQNVTASVLAFLRGRPEMAARLRRYAGLNRDEELANALVLYTAVLRDVQKAGGGNPFDNRNTIYVGTGDDDAVNDGVRRYAAERQAADYLRRNYTPTGRLEGPLVALHTTYDPIIPASISNDYAARVDDAGASGLFEQKYVKRSGHCAFLPNEVNQSFGTLERQVAVGSAHRN